MNLAELQSRDTGIIVKVKGTGSFRKRILEMGFVKGQKITVIKNAPLKDPIEYRIMNYDLSLRRQEAELIEVVMDESRDEPVHENFTGILSDKNHHPSIRSPEKIIQVALIGNPNSGKTSLYNYASKSREHVGNYSGVTVDLRKATLNHGGYRIVLTDLPGTYSLSDYSPEELFVRQHISKGSPDVVINVVDGSNLERNLYLTTQLIEMEVKLVLALNMYDELQKSGDQFDYKSLSKMMGAPIIPTVASRGRGISKLMDAVIEVFEGTAMDMRQIQISYGTDTELSINKIRQVIENLPEEKKEISSRYCAIKMLEASQDTKKHISKWKNFPAVMEVVNTELSNLHKATNEEPEVLITDSRYGFIAGALRETLTKNPNHKRNDSELIDTVLTHKIFGLPILFFILFVAFFATFKLGEYPMLWLQSLIGIFGTTLSRIMPPGPFTDLLTEGIIGGVGSVIVFLPNILILFYCISLMEDTGYMARAAFIMDKLMHKIGLHGRSFIPLIMGFGCNVPAIMATRTVINRNNRLVTMLINPFMSCSARLPVYILIIGAFFPDNPGLMLFLMYAIGIVMASVFAILFKKTFFRAEEAPFVMELPPYRVPGLKATLKHMWSKGSQYLKKMGGVILVASILIWGLGYYPRNQTTATRPIKENISGFDSPEQSGSGAGLTGKASAEEQFQKAGNLENSYIGYIGKFIEPVLKPLGFDWKMSVSLLTGIAAKEVVVSTMGVLYKAEPSETGETESLSQRMKNEKYLSGDKDKIGTPVFNNVVALSYMVFILLYFPCVAVVAAIKKESGSWKWALFSILYTTGLAWIASFIVFQVGSLFN